MNTAGFGFAPTYPVYSNIGLIVGETSMLKNTLQGLPRIMNGPLNASAKCEVRILVQKYLRKVDSLKSLVPLDAQISIMLDQLETDSENLANCASKNNGGYERIEALFAKIMAQVGFIQGYLHCLSNLGNLKRNGNNLQNLF
jgi:hypothetical protein